MSRARAAVLRTLIAAGDAITVATLADRLGQHPNTVREHLDALVATGRVERLRSDPVGRGRPAWLYRASGPVSAADPDDLGGAAVDGAGQEYAALAVALIDQVANASPDPGDMARQAGERWGHALLAQRAVARPAPAGTSGHYRDGSGTADSEDPAAAVVDLLDGLRFEPQPGPGVVRLTTCPLLDAARRNPEVVCQVHLGIVRGVLGELGADPDAADLVPFAEPGACRLTLPGLR
jgi:predicted ArsR family transcriptional regulator